MSESFDAWSLPPDVSLPPRRSEGTLRFLEVTAPWLDALLGRLEEARVERGVRPAAETAEVLGRVGQRFLDPADPLRARALEALPGHAGLSVEMAAHVLDGMARDWTTDRLLLHLEAELGDPAVLERFVPDGPRQVRARPRSPALHVGSGSVPGVTATSLIRGLLVGSALVVKPGAGDVVLPVLFHQALAELDPALAATCAVVYWPGGALDPWPTRPRTVVVYGDDRTIAAVRRSAPVHARLVEYPHRVSVAVLDAERATADEVAEALAAAVGTFERRGCVSAYHAWVEDPDGDRCARLGPRVAEALRTWGGRLPPPEDLGGAALRRQWISTLQMRSAAGEPVQVWDAGAAGCVVLGEVGALPDGRVVALRPVPDLETAFAEVEALRPHLQSVALEAGPEWRDAWAERAARAGALRVTTLADLPWPPAWWHHDGSGSLEPLLDLVDLEG